MATGQTLASCRADPTNRAPTPHGTAHTRAGRHSRLGSRETAPLLCALALASAAAAQLSYPPVLEAFGVTVRLEVLPDGPWVRFTGDIGVAGISGFQQAGTIYVKESALRRDLPHEFSHAYEFARFGWVDVGLVNACLSGSIPPGVSPLYYCQRTEVRARDYETRYRLACGDSLAGLNYPGEAPCKSQPPRP